MHVTRLHFLTASLALVIALNFASFSPMPPAAQQVAGIKVTAAVCADTDGGRFANVAGTASGKAYKKKYADVCLDSGRVKEYYCSKNKIVYKAMACGDEEECVEGQCQAVEDEEDYASDSEAPTENPLSPYGCRDSDEGQVAGVRGTTSEKTAEAKRSYTDACTDTTHLTEYYCAGEQAIAVSLTCGGDETCFMGQCAPSAAVSALQGGSPTATATTPNIFNLSAHAVTEHQAPSTSTKLSTFIVSASQRESTLSSITFTVDQTNMVVSDWKLYKLNYKRTQMVASTARPTVTTISPTRSRVTFRDTQVLLAGETYFIALYGNTTRVSGTGTVVVEVSETGDAAYTNAEPRGTYPAQGNTTIFDEPRLSFGSRESSYTYAPAASTQLSTYSITALGLRPGKLGTITLTVSAPFILSDYKLRLQAVGDAPITVSPARVSVNPYLPQETAVTFIPNLSLPPNKTYMFSLLANTSQGRTLTEPATITTVVVNPADFLTEGSLGAPRFPYDGDTVTISVPTSATNSAPPPSPGTTATPTTSASVLYLSHDSTYLEATSAPRAKTASDVIGFFKLITGRNQSINLRGLTFNVTATNLNPARFQLYLASTSPKLLTTAPAEITTLSDDGQTQRYRIKLTLSEPLTVGSKLTTLLLKTNTTAASQEARLSSSITAEILSSEYVDSNADLRLVRFPVTGFTRVFPPDRP